MQAIETKRNVYGVEPLTLDELKNALGASYTDHNGYLTYLKEAAREYCEVEGNVGLVRQTVTAWLPEMCNWYQLPFSPIVSITSVKSYSLGVVQSTLEYGDSYYISGDRIYFIAPVQPYQVEVIYEAGYYTAPAGTTTTTTPATAPEYEVAAQLCPKMVKVAIERLVRDWYDNPESIGTLGRDAKQIIRKFGRRDWLWKLQQQGSFGQRCYSIRM
jgi:hypothetical protein